MKATITIEFNGSYHRFANLVDQLGSNRDVTITGSHIEHSHKPVYPAGSWAQRHSPEIHMREWARKQPEFQDRLIGERGRLPSDIVEAYYWAHPDQHL